VLRVFDCLTQQHDYRLVVLALLVCAVGSYAAVTLLNHVRIAQGRARWIWLGATAIATGHAIWATHFIAMLAFSPGGPTGYDFSLTLLSLVVAVALTGAAYYVATTGGVRMQAVGGAMVGCGIAAMHYTGMAAFRISGFIAWDGSLVAASIALGCAFGAAALVIGSSEASWRSRAYSALLLTLAIFSHHFTAMGAASLVRDPTVTVAETALAPDWMAFGIAIAGLEILALTLIGVELDRRDRRRTAAFARDMTAARRAEEHQKLLIAELDHRVKNVLARVAAVVQRTREGSASTEDFARALEGRIQSMADAHALLSQTRWLGVSLADVVHNELAPYATADNTSIDGPGIVLTAEATQAVAMVFHELVTNAAKYGALSNSHGRVSVRWQRPLNGASQPKLTIIWQEADGPPVAAPTRHGYGTSVIRDLIPYEFGGTVDLGHAAGGVRCRIEIPLERVTSDERSPSLLSERRSPAPPDAVAPAAISH